MLATQARKLIRQHPILLLPELCARDVLEEHMTETGRSGRYATSSDIRKMWILLEGRIEKGWDGSQRSKGRARDIAVHTLTVGEYVAVGYSGQS